MPTSKKRRPKTAQKGTRPRKQGLPRTVEGLPSLAPILASAPPEVAAPIVKLCSELSGEEREYVRAVAELDLIDASPEAAAGIVHHAAVVAPVLHAFIAAQHGDRTDEERVYDASSMRDMLRDHWGDTPDHYDLHERNRFFYARGAALYATVMGWKPERAANIHPMDIRLDRHLMWIGSRFEDLKPYAAEILKAGRLDPEFLGEISSRWIPEDQRDIPFEFYMDNTDRIEGYRKNGFHSTAAESTLEQLREKHGMYAVVAVNGVRVPLLEAMHLISWKDEIKQEATAVALLLAATSPSNTVEREVFTFLNLLPNEVLTPMHAALAGYSPEDCALAADRLASLYGVSDPSAPLSQIHVEALARVIAAPVLAAFADATYEHEPFVPPTLESWIDFTRDDCESDEQYEEWIAEARTALDEEMPEIRADHEAEEEDFYKSHRDDVAEWIEQDALESLTELAESEPLGEAPHEVRLGCFLVCAEVIMGDLSWGGKDAIHRFTENLRTRGININVEFTDA